MWQLRVEEPKPWQQAGAKPLLRAAVVLKPAEHISRDTGVLGSAPNSGLCKVTASTRISSFQECFRITAVLDKQESNSYSFVFLLFVHLLEILKGLRVVMWWIESKLWIQEIFQKMEPVFSQEHSYESLNRDISLKILLCPITICLFFPHRNEWKVCKFPAPNNGRIPALLLLILLNYYTYGLCGRCSGLLRFRGQCELTDFGGVILCLQSLLCIWCCVLPAHGRDFSLGIVQLFSGMLLAKCV